MTKLILVVAWVLFALFEGGCLYAVSRFAEVVGTWVPGHGYGFEGEVVAGRKWPQKRPLRFISHFKTAAHT